MMKKEKKNLAQYIIKAPVSQEKMFYDRENQKVVYKSNDGMIVYERLAAIEKLIEEKKVRAEPQDQPLWNSTFHLTADAPLPF